MPCTYRILPGLQAPVWKGTGAGEKAAGVEAAGLVYDNKMVLLAPVSWESDSCLAIPVLPVFFMSLN